MQQKFMANKEQLDSDLGCPGIHPEPPTNLKTRDLPIIQIEKPWFRIHQSHHSPLYYGDSGKYRFDAPAQEYGVMYIALDPHGCFIETFGSQTGIQVISYQELSLRSISALNCDRPLQLVDMSGAGLAHIGADARLTTAEYKVAQRWALALWNHPSQVDGIYYRARHDLSQLCAAIFNRAKSVFTISNTQICTNRSFQKTLATILETYKFGLID